MAAPTSASEGYKVPEWALRNREVLLRQKVDKKGSDVAGKENTTGKRLVLVSTTSSVKASARYAAVTTAVEYLGTKDATSQRGLPPSFFENVDNHPAVLATIINTARANANFIVNATGTDITPEEQEKFVTGYNAFLTELNKYSLYVNLVDQAANTLENNRIDCSFLVNAIIDVVAGAAQLTTSDKGYKKFVDDVKNVITTLVKNVTSYGKSTSLAAEQLVLRGKATGGTSSEENRNPVTATGLTATSLSKRADGKDTLDATHLNINRYTWQLNSDIVIALAADLAESLSIITPSNVVVQEVRTPFS